MEYNMSNQILLWSLLVLPWFTLFLMKKEDIKRFMPVAIFSALTSVIIVEVGQTLQLWVVRETAFPLKSISYLFSLNPIIIMWILRFTYGRFMVYIIVEIVSNLTFSYVFLGYFLTARGIYENINANALHVFLITTLHGLLLYGYQKWQDDGKRKIFDA